MDEIDVLQPKDLAILVKQNSSYEEEFPAITAPNKRHKISGSSSESETSKKLKSFNLTPHKYKIVHIWLI